MRIYVASKFENTAEVRDAMSRLRDMGHEITHDWTQESAEGVAADALDEFLTECAVKDMYGVKTADVVLLINHKNGQGMWTELGMAIAWEIPVFFVFPTRTPTNVFTHINGVETYDEMDTTMMAINDFATLLEG